MNTDDSLIDVQCVTGEIFKLSSNSLKRHSIYLFNRIECFPHLQNCTIRLKLSYLTTARIVEFMTNGDPFLTSIDNAMEVYVVSKEFEIPELFKQCRNFLVTLMTDTNVCRIHDFACEQSDTILQYYCWKMFDSHWETILNGEDFLHCKDQTIERFVSRPIYPENLTEFVLFSAIYNWAKLRVRDKEESNENLDDFTIGETCRAILNPYLSRIRFLVMDYDNLEYIFQQLHVLKPNEFNAIRDYPINEDLSNFPTISEKTANRLQESYTDENFNNPLFIYKNRRNLGSTRIGQLLMRKFFACHVVVTEDCFIESLQLPITHCNVEGILVNIQGIVGINSTLVNLESLTCRTDGLIILQEPIFLERNSNAYLEASIPIEELTIENSVLSSCNADSYINDLYLSELSLFGKGRNTEDWDIFYFDVNLYF
ncbi:uncharacterized protein LOC111620212 [Centruroides sculpturatus]|uniref:uncharacterized protein LOC111620212 n=1 Tax=Centruroides sculpturatus TaxID=218467 RepID=UPI000C6E2517|nr:uncharacterized protein LOC111620212 [Centruroides sculpturatus]